MFSKTWFVFLEVIFLSDFSCGQTDKIFIPADYNYIQAVDSFYKLHTSPRTFADAKSVCAQEGASLFYPENDDEAHAVIEFWNSTQPNTDETVFLGLTDVKFEGVFETIDGRPISEVYNNWRHGEPNDDYGREDCVALYQHGYFNDVWCGDMEQFICKKSQSLERNNYCDLCHLGGQTDKISIPADYNYIQAVDSFYKLHTSPRTFADAKSVCAQEGASLFYPENDDEAHAVIEFWNSTQPNTDETVFLGLTDVKFEGVFETIDGRPISEVYNNWRHGEPNDDYGREDCVALYQHGYFNDVWCGDMEQFICKKSQSLERNNYCDLCHLGYTCNKDIGKCYKLHTTPMNWTDAYEMCQTEYAFLAVISNHNEADYLAKLTRSTSKLRIKEQYQRGIYHLGFHNRFGEGWQTIGGKPMNVDADVWFDSYQPDGNLYEECGAMLFNGRLINTDCNMKNLFICERVVESSNLLNEENVY